MTRESAAECLRSKHVDLLRVMWCDNANVIRAKSIYLPPVRATNDDDGTMINQLERAITASVALQALPVTHDEPATAANLPPVKDVRLIPDWTSFSPCTATTSVTSVIADMVDRDTPWPLCPRHYLRRMTQRASEAGIVIEVGAELEFFLLKPTDDKNEFPAPVDQSPFGSTVAAELNSEVIGEMLRALEMRGVPVEQYYPESGPGQQEITLAHCDPLQLADRVIHARETIRSVAMRHGLIASFVPLIFEEATGSGMHVHFSLRDTKGKSIMADSSRKWGLSQTAGNFIAGVLEHLPALMATTTPSVNSFRRIRPHEWSGAFQAWGVSNKEAALRLIDDPVDGDPRHVELKTSDASSNPYVSLASIIAAGIDGVTNKSRLPDPVGIDPGNYTDEQRTKQGIRALPTDLGRAITELEADTMLCSAMGDEFATAYLAVRKMELDVMKGMSLAEERKLLLQRY